MPAPTLRLSSFDEALDAVRAAARAKAPAGDGWPLAQAIAHAAAGIEYSLTRYPQYKPALFRATVGRIALWKFLRQGYMSHDRKAPIPGEPAVSQLATEDAVKRLEEAVRRFRAHQGELAPHFAYGPVTKADYEKIHAMHLADHLALYATPT